MGFFSPFRNRNLYNKAIKYFHNGRVNEALEIFESIPSTAPASIYNRVLVSKAFIYSNNKKDRAKALEILDQVPSTSNMYMQSLVEKIKLLREWGNEEEALKIYDLMPKTHEDYCNYAWEKYRALKDAKRYQEGIDYLSQALNESHNGEYLDGLRSIGGLYHLLGNKEKCEEYINKANKLSQEWFSQGRIPSMVTSSVPSSIQADDNLQKARLAFRRSDYNSAIPLFEKYAENASPDARTCDEWALSLLRYGWDLDVEEKRRLLPKAIELGQKAVEQAPDNALYNSNLGLYMFQLALAENNLKEKMPEIVPVLEHGQELEMGTSSYAANSLACAYSLINDTEKAFYWFEVMLKEDKKGDFSRNDIENDDDFANIKEDKRFEELLDKYL